MNNLATIISEYGFPVVACVGLGYFIYYVWNYMNLHVKPELGKMHMALIKVIDQTRMLDQDMIRLQQKVNVVLEYRARQEVLEDAEEKEALEEIKNLEKEKGTKRK
jgi:hypothetical protein|tara:strand:+ start:320 stop:637 length:318 start_codon:yes stop_codon:yes gene_type:complete